MRSLSKSNIETRDKYDGSFMAPSDAAALGKLMGYASRLQGQKLFRDGSRFASDGFQYLIESVLTCDYMRARFFSPFDGEVYFELRTFDKNDTCFLFRLNAEELWVTAHACESVLAELTKTKGTET